MLKFTLLLSLLLTLPALAQRIELAKITNDLDKEVVTFYLHLDQNKEIDSVSYVTRDEHGSIIKEKDWIYSEVANGGVVLDVRNGYDILKLYMNEDFSRSNGGMISLNYLYNGATGTRRFMNFEVKKFGSDYRLFYSNNLVERLHIRTKHIRLIGLVGIEKIQVTYAQ